MTPPKRIMCVTCKGTGRSKRGACPVCAGRGWRRLSEIRRKAFRQGFGS